MTQQFKNKQTQKICLLPKKNWLVDRKYQFYFLYKEFFKKIYAILYVRVFCLHVYTHTTSMPGAEVRRGCWILQKWSYRQLLATMWVLGIECGVFARTLWTTESTLQLLVFWISSIKCIVYACV